MLQNESFLWPGIKRLKPLKCYVESNGLLKVNTRILMREDTRNFRFPLLLSRIQPILLKPIQTRYLS